MSRWYVIVENPSNGALFALREEDEDSMATFEDEESAEEAGKNNFFGHHGYYQVFQYD